jgi:homogentisate 1,2-dioxygenase
VLAPHDEDLRELVVRRAGVWHGFELEHSPHDVVGWDGTVYPWAFPILAFQPRVSSVHLPPTWHGTFAARNALICSFVPRPLDFAPDAIPCPYPHSSTHCDEIIFYCDGSFTSRRGVGPGSISHHPMGIPHGPHPGAYEASIGAKATTALAVMLDLYQPLHPTAAARAVEDPGYHDSFR